ncbi:MAG: phosphodiester glycosidase family protein [Candidatus Competibacteraceae bacterium]|nr:phosphodiester glycosidase family protein [Candidatus Competibacteraceae bacterium]
MDTTESGGPFIKIITITGPGWNGWRGYIVTLTLWLLSTTALAEVPIEHEGLTVRQTTLGGTRLIVARLEPGTFKTGIRPGRFDGSSSEGWQVTVNGSYFDGQNRPVYLLREGRHEIAPFRRSASGVFWCRAGKCAIDHASRFAPNRPTDLAVQSAPRLLGGGRPTRGVRRADDKDARAGLAITEDGAVLVFATAAWPWGKVSFNELRRYLVEHYDVRDILMLDGGSSTRLTVTAGERTVTNGPTLRSVPYSIVFRQDKGAGTR